MSDAGKAFKIIGRAVGGVGLGLTYLQGGVELSKTGKVSTSTMVDASISTFYIYVVFLVALLHHYSGGRVQFTVVSGHSGEIILIIGLIINKNKSC